MENPFARPLNQRTQDWWVNYVIKLHSAVGRVFYLSKLKLVSQAFTEYTLQRFSLGTAPNFSCLDQTFSFLKGCFANLAFSLQDKTIKPPFPFLKYIFLLYFFRVRRTDSFGGWGRQPKKYCSKVSDFFTDTHASCLILVFKSRTIFTSLYFFNSLYSVLST